MNAMTDCDPAFTDAVCSKIRNLIDVDLTTAVPKLQKAIARYNRRRKTIGVSQRSIADATGQTFLDSMRLSRRLRDPLVRNSFVRSGINVKLLRESLSIVAGKSLVASRQARRLSHRGRKPVTPALQKLAAELAFSAGLPLTDTRNDFRKTKSGALHELMAIILKEVLGQDINDGTISYVIRRAREAQNFKARATM